MEDAPPSFWAFEVPPGGSLTQQLTSDGCVCITGATLSAPGDTHRSVLRASSGGFSGVLCNLFGGSGHEYARLGHPFNEDFTLTVKGTTSVHISGFSRGDIGPAETEARLYGEEKAKPKAKSAAPVGGSIASRARAMSDTEAMGLDGASDDDDDDDDEGEGEGDEALDEELAEVERQLRELEMEEAGDGIRHDRLEDDVVAYESVRRAATKEEVEDFDKLLSATLVDAKKATAARGLKPMADAPKVPVGLLRAGGGGGGGGGAGAGGGGGGGAGVADGEALALRVLTKRGPKQKVEAAAVQVPLDAALAKSVLQVDAAATQERQALKRQILAAAADHESAGPTYIQQIRQKELDAGTPGGTKQRW